MKWKSGAWRRSAALTAGGATLMFAAAACGGGSSGDAGGAGSLTIAAFGGTYGDAEAKAYFDPYAKDKGTEMKRVDAEASLAQVKLQVDSGNVLWDIVELAGPDAVIGCQQGLLEKVDLSADEQSALEKNGASDCGVAASIYAEGIAYDPTKIKTPPTWQDFYDFNKYPGKRTVESYIQDGTLEYALLGSGVSKDDLYPLDLQRATDTLNGASDNLIVVDSLAQASQLLTSGEATMIQTASGRVIPLQAAGLNVAFNPVGQVAPSVFAVPKGAPHAKEALAFLKWMVSCKACSTSMATATGYSGPNAAGNKAVTGDVAKFLPSNPDVAASSFPQDIDWWAENADKAQQAWDAFATGTGG